VRPRGIVRWWMRALIPLYRVRIGPRSLGEILLWALFWHPHILVVHRGRRSGIERQTLLEVIGFDPVRREWTVAAMFGPKSDWYRNISASPVIEVEVRGRRFRPEQRIFGDREAQGALDAYRLTHPVWGRIVASMIRRPFTAACMPVVAFRDAAPSE
jgi:deazaflavin-dependent oxidoreductase (nitroreductase family)